MLFLEIYMGLSFVSFLIILILLKISPSGWQDENGFHLAEEKEKLITFPLRKNVAGNFLTINFNLARNEKLEKRNSGLQITLGQ
jgi:hypothetical protein